MRSIFTLCAACILGGLLGGACANSRKDAHCSPDAPSISADPGCIYQGDGKGPAFHEPKCPPPSGQKPADCSTSFDAVVEMMSDSTRGDCTETACHGNPETASVGVVLDPGDPAGFYQQLTSVKGSVGTPYVVADDPTTPANEALDSWIQCNLVADPGGGFPMPTWSGLTNLADADAVDDWLLCGAPGPP